MVATAMAGISITRQTVVSLNNAFKLYAMMALLSFLGAGVWQSMHFSSTAPQGFMIQFYQRALGHLDGRSCSAYPVCSAYARQALAQHGWLWGSWLAMDRLIHEADDLQGLHKRHMIVFEGEQRLYDPLSRNDFWLK